MFYLEFDLKNCIYDDTKFLPQETGHLVLAWPDCLKLPVDSAVRSYHAIKCQYVLLGKRFISNAIQKPARTYKVKPNRIQTQKTSQRRNTNN